MNKYLWNDMLSSLGICQVAVISNSSRICPTTTKQQLASQPARYEPAARHIRPLSVSLPLFLTCPWPTSSRLSPFALSSLFLFFCPSPFCASTPFPSHFPIPPINLLYIMPMAWRNPQGDTLAGPVDVLPLTSLCCLGL